MRSKSEMIDSERNRKAIVIRENNKFRFMNTDDKEIDINTLRLRSRLTGGDIRYYEMNLSEERLKGMPPDAFIQALNYRPDMADTSDIMIEV